MTEQRGFIIHAPEAESLFTPDSHVEKVADGFQFTEGPVWMPDDSLLFSDIPASKIYRWSEEDGLSVWRQQSNHANGNTADAHGRLLTCEHGARRVTRTDYATGKMTVLAEYYGGKRLNSPNDVVVKSDGSIWFTDPTYGVAADKIEQPRNYVFRLDHGAEEPVPVADDFAMPNGLCFSPDEKLLYIADSSDRKHIRVFKVKKDNTLYGERFFAQIGNGVPDGMRVDQAGRLFSTAADGIHVFSPDGELLAKIMIPEVTANCTFGDNDRRTLYMTASTSIYRIRLSTTGAR